MFNFNDLGTTNVIEGFWWVYLGGFVLMMLVVLRALLLREFSWKEWAGLLLLSVGVTLGFWLGGEKRSLIWFSWNLVGKGLPHGIGTLMGQVLIGKVWLILIGFWIQLLGVMIMLFYGLLTLRNRMWVNAALYVTMWLFLGLVYIYVPLRMYYLYYMME